jgi:hypothetical protein
LPPVVGEAAAALVLVSAKIDHSRRHNTIRRLPFEGYGGTISLDTEVGIPRVPGIPICPFLCPSGAIARRVGAPRATPTPRIHERRNGQKQHQALLKTVPVTSTGRASESGSSTKGRGSGRYFASRRFCSMTSLYEVFSTRMASVLV